MSKIAPEEILEHLPKRTPRWAIGMTTIIVAVATSLVTLYVVSREDMKAIVLRNIEHQDTENRLQFQEQDTALVSVLKIMEVNSSKIMSLSTLLGAVQNQNTILTERVVALEKDVNNLKGVLVDCERKLKECINKK